MHDKVSVVDRFGFGFLPGILFRAKSAAMQISISFQTKFRGGGAEASEGEPPVEESAYQIL